MLDFFSVELEIITHFDSLASVVLSFCVKHRFVLEFDCCHGCFPPCPTPAHYLFFSFQAEDSQIKWIG